MLGTYCPGSNGENINFCWKPGGIRPDDSIQSRFRPWKVLGGQKKKRMKMGEPGLGISVMAASSFAPD